MILKTLIHCHCCWSCCSCSASQAPPVSWPPLQHQHSPCWSCWAELSCSLSWTIPKIFSSILENIFYSSFINRNDHHWMEDSDKKAVWSSASENDWLFFLPSWRQLSTELQTALTLLDCSWTHWNNICWRIKKIFGEQSG